MFRRGSELGNMFQFKCDFNDYYCDARQIEASRALHPGLQSYDDWLAAQHHLIPFE